MLRQIMYRLVGSIGLGCLPAERIGRTIVLPPIDEDNQLEPETGKLAIPDPRFNSFQGRRYKLGLRLNLPGTEIARRSLRRFQNYRTRKRTVVHRRICDADASTVFIALLVGFCGGRSGTFSCRFSADRNRPIPGYLMNRASVEMHIYPHARVPRPMEVIGSVVRRCTEHRSPKRSY